MGDQPVHVATDDAQVRPRWRFVGPGLVVAATGVGAADLVATLVAGAKAEIDRVQAMGGGQGTDLHLSRLFCR